MERDVARLHNFIQRLKNAQESDKFSLLDNFNTHGSDRCDTPINEALSSDDQSTEAESYDDHEDSANHLVIGENGEAAYHGPTSILFSQGLHDLTQEDSHTPLNYYRYQLTAAAAEQRKTD